MSPGNAVGLKCGDKFCGTGFNAWQFKTKLALIQQDVWSLVEGDDATDGSKKGKQVTDEGLAEKTKKENLAYTFIMLSLSDAVQSVVK